MHRTDLLQLLAACLAAQQPAYARQVAQRYLADWPGDLGVQLCLARACAAEGNTAQAVKLLEAITRADPEDFAAFQFLGDQLAAMDNPATAAQAYINAGMGTDFPSLRVGAGMGALPWTAAYIALRAGDWETARRESEPWLETETVSPLPSLIHLCALWHAGQLDLARPLAEGFHARWPEAVIFKLCLAECLLAAGENVRALELLHDAAAQDSGGQVLTRHRGQAHPYRALWNANLEFTLTLPGPLPAAVITSLGLNRLSAPISGHQQSKIQNQQSEIQNPPLPETLLDIQAQLNAVAARLSSKQVAHQSPAITDQQYIILSSRQALTRVFGAQNFTVIDTAIKTLAVNATAHLKLSAQVLYVDDAATLNPFGLRPVDAANAWDIKTLLSKLATRLKDRGQAISAVLIVGGPDIIPFHHLPNPTDDPDPDIPSDNPYATPDENYFVPEWPVGRIPSSGSDPAPLLRALRLAAGLHDQEKAARGLSGWFTRLWRQFFGPRNTTSQPGNFGYSANVWREASTAVYTAIGNPSALLTCPPVDANALPADGLAPARLSYFNLHGVEDGAEWYGQRRSDDPDTTPEYPVALRPADVTNSGHAPRIVFSEACYGTNIFDKRKVDEALCLRFLDSGTRVMVGSTKIAYGAVSQPLIGADLLGRCFWQNINTGLPAGEALRRAKLQMAQEMHTRQGFLDGEDQKTLISFVLYGDPLATVPAAAKAAHAKFALPRTSTPPATIIDKANGNAELTPEMVGHIKSVVAQYLPGMHDAQWQVAQARAGCAVGAKHTAPAHPPQHTVITLSKTIRVQARAHSHFARVTLDEKGALIKLAVSR